MAALLSRITGFFKPRPPAPTGMAALKAKRVAPPPGFEAKTRKESPPPTSRESLGKGGLVVIGVVLGGFSLMSLLSSRHYGQEAREKQKNYIPLKHREGVEPVPLPRSFLHKVGWA
eukprot:TRINITY_DN25613_c0_g1_i1.p1 TRINITY_DN25613_c0_g1~~TRINITY_DN25613_c0_g1_i1.p1  ORF type:complete len:116 (+),score=7.95 TRINITY_DN25613_c0_g1_i1:55-402(+)